MVQDQDAEDLPRVLILCDEPTNTISGGGVTMGNLFRGWPKDRIAQVWAHHRFEIDTEVCTQSLRLGNHELPGRAWVPQAVRQQRGLVKRVRPLVRPGVRVDYDRVRQWAQQFRPDVVYAQLTPYPMYTWWLPRIIARDLGVPLVNHIMDDWPTAVQAEWLPGYRLAACALLQRQLRLLFGAAVRNLAICEQMAQAFAERYGTSFATFHNCVDLDLWSQPKLEYAPASNEFHVAYLGALSETTQLLSLRDVAQAVTALAGRGEPIRLTVYTGSMYVDYFRQYLGGFPAVTHGGAVARGDLCRCLASADLLVLPVNFGRAGGFARLSMPTKVPEYMASGTPVLVYAPEHVPPAVYARVEGWGHVLDTPSIDALEGAILELRESPALRERLGRRARDLAVERHSAQVTRDDFRSLMCDAAQHGRSSDFSPKA